MKRYSRPAVHAPLCISVRGVRSLEVGDSQVAHEAAEMRSSESGYDATVGTLRLVGGGSSRGSRRPSGWSDRFAPHPRMVGRPPGPAALLVLPALGQSLVAQ